MESVINLLNECKWKRKVKGWVMPRQVQVVGYKVTGNYEGVRGKDSGFYW